MQFDLKHIVTIFFACLITSYLTYKIMGKTPTIDFQKEWYEKRQSELKREIDSLSNKLSVEFKNSDMYESKIDSIENVKQKIKYIYVTKYKEIDTASVGSIVNQFQDLFTKSGVK